MTDIHIVRDYPHPPAKVWLAVTDPELIPLWTATGAGSVARQIMGTTVIGGMLAASAIGIFFIPAMFYIVSRFETKKSAQVVEMQAARAGDD